MDIVVKWVWCTWNIGHSTIAVEFVKDSDAHNYELFCYKDPTFTSANSSYLLNTLIDINLNKMINQSQSTTGWEASIH